MQLQHISKLVGFFGVLYLLLIVPVYFGYEFSQEYIKPVMALVFPLSPESTRIKSVLVMSGMYWGFVLVYLFLINKKSDD